MNSLVKVCNNYLEKSFQSLFASLFSGAVSLSKRLQEIMNEQRPPLTQRAFASTVGVTQGAVAGWLAGTEPYPRNIEAICEAFGVKRDWLLYGEGPKREKRCPRVKTGRGPLAERERESGYSINEKVTIIRKSGTREQLEMLDDFLDSVCRQLGYPDARSRRKSRRS